MITEHAPIPWEVHGDTPERPPMIWDASGDAIVSRMPDGRPYFEPGDAALIARAVNSHEALVDALKALISADNGGWATHHAAEDTYCPDCADESDAWRNQREHHLGCRYLARMEAARAAIAKADGGNS